MHCVCSMSIRSGFTTTSLTVTNRHAINSSSCRIIVHSRYLNIVLSISINKPNNLLHTVHIAIHQVRAPLSPTLLCHCVVWKLYITTSFALHFVIRHGTPPNAVIVRTPIISSFTSISSISNWPLQNYLDFWMQNVCRWMFCLLWMNTPHIIRIILAHKMLPFHIS